MSLNLIPLRPLHSKLSEEFRLTLVGHREIQKTVIEFCQKHINLIPEDRRRLYLGYGRNRKVVIMDDLTKYNPMPYQVMDWEKHILKCLAELKFCNAISGNGSIKEGVGALMETSPRYHSRLETAYRRTDQIELKREIFYYLRYTYASHLHNYEENVPNRQKMKLFFSGNLTPSGFTNDEILKLCGWLETEYGIQI